MIATLRVSRQRTAVYFGYTLYYPARASRSVQRDAYRLLRKHRTCRCGRLHLTHPGHNFTCTLSRHFPAEFWLRETRPGHAIPPGVTSTKHLSFPSFSYRISIRAPERDTVFFLPRRPVFVVSETAEIIVYSSIRTYYTIARFGSQKPAIRIRSVIVAVRAAVIRVNGGRSRAEEKRGSVTISSGRRISPVITLISGT